MSRRIKTAHRTISNRGPRPRFTGYFPSFKRDARVAALYLAFDSITALKVGIFLEWLPTTKWLTYEAERLTVRRPDGTCFEHIPDFGVNSHDGGIGFVEAKYDAGDLRPRDRERLEHAEAHLTAAGYSYQVCFRTSLERDGMVDTLLLLRRYGRLNVRDDVATAALRTLNSDVPRTLDEYRHATSAAGLSLSVTYWLLYHQRLPLRYETFVHEEMKLCRV
jgi:hypothetical protein